MDGMKILYIARQLDQQFLEEMLDIQMSLVRNIGNRFHYDAPHAAWVENMCCVLFDALAPSQAWTRRTRSSSGRRPTCTISGNTPPCGPMTGTTTI